LFKRFCVALLRASFLPIRLTDSSHLDPPKLRFENSIAQLARNT
jgi:hypothetical protein